MSHDDAADVRALAHALSEIARALESTDEPARRVHRVLELAHHLVPYAQCTVLAVFSSGPPALVAHPPLPPADEAEVRQRLEATLALFSDDGDDEPLSASASTHVTLPLMGLDQVIGVIRATPPGDAEYQASDVRLLSVVAAQLGSYLALIKLHAEQERRASDLAMLAEVQRTLAGIVSHDLRNPLHIITTVADSLLARTTDAAQARALERALRNAEKATRIINDLLDVTQIRAGGMIATQPARTELRALVAELLEDERTAHPGRTLTLAEGPPVVGCWDRDRLSQLATNLVENALAHGDAHPITIDLDADGATATLRVHNRGPAIPDDLLPSIFDPFKRGPRHRRRGGGIGLGLYIVDQIARAHGGTVTVDSAGDSTTFTVTLPIVAAAAADTAIPAPVGDDATRPLVMVVDDDDDIRANMAALLERRGYAVALAANGAEALAILRDGLRPRLLLVDLQMPIMDGEALCTACRADPALASIPFLLVSADATAAGRAARLGTAYLGKPVTPQLLTDTVAHLSRHLPH